VVVAALGRGKAAIVREAIEEPSSPLPVALVARRARRCIFFMDAEAASRLSRREPFPGAD